MKSTIARLFMALILALAAARVASAQGSFFTSLSGTVVDSSGAVIPGADVKIKNTGTGAEFTAVSGSDGGFTVNGLSGGTYSVTVRGEPESPAHRLDELSPHQLDAGYDQQAQLPFPGAPNAPQTTAGLRLGMTNTFSTTGTGPGRNRRLAARQLDRWLERRQLPPHAAPRRQHEPPHAAGLAGSLVGRINARVSTFNSQRKPRELSAEARRQYMPR